MLPGEHTGEDGCCGPNHRAPGEALFLKHLFSLQDMTLFFLCPGASLIRCSQVDEGFIRSASFPFGFWCSSVTFSSLEHVLTSLSPGSSPGGLRCMILPSKRWYGSDWKVWGQLAASHPDSLSISMYRLRAGPQSPSRV